jgi:hypothetical protein
LGKAPPRSAPGSGKAGPFCVASCCAQAGDARQVIIAANMTSRCIGAEVLSNAFAGRHLADLLTSTLYSNFCSHSNTDANNDQMKKTQPFGWGSLPCGRSEPLTDRFTVEGVCYSKMKKKPQRGRAEASPIEGCWVGENPAREDYRKLVSKCAVVCFNFYLSSDTACPGPTTVLSRSLIWSKIALPAQSG